MSALSDFLLAVQELLDEIKSSPIEDFTKLDPEEGRLMLTQEMWNQITSVESLQTSAEIELQQVIEGKATYG